MGLIAKKYVDEDCQLGMWMITEDYDTLLSKVTLTPEEFDKLNNFQSHFRKLEWLSVRVLINTMLERDMRIVYNEVRKPFLHDNSYNISISHSKQLTSILLSKHKRVGIDLEYMSHRIGDVAFKFINENEKITDVDSQKTIHLYIHWCAKEALYKICDKQNINFKQNLSIVPFEIQNQGNLVGILENKFGKEHFNLSYFLLENYVVTWCNK